MGDTETLDEVKEIPERFVPEQMHGQLVEAEHIARYSWAASFCSGRRVLDAGCGTGYGSELINVAGASEVVAIDRSEAALDLARATVSEGVTCQLGDVAELSFADDSFDAVVCFEVIEHVDDPDRVLDEFARVLRPDGLLIVSSPNRDRYVPGNPHHVRELVRDEMQAMLDARFASARIISQHVMLASAISWSGAPEFEGATTLRPVPPVSEDELYLLAIAGSELPPDPGPIVTLGHFAEPRRWLEHIDGQRRYIERQTRDLRVAYDQGLERRQALVQLAEAQSEIAALVAHTAEFDESRLELDQARERLAEAEGELTRLRADKEALSGRLVSLERLKASRVWKLAKQLRRLVDV
jgi:2-polyprenyl-3-methyl-5-hydroxy-6-metoxy-1,4-benzoquinol methylase